MNEPTKFYRHLIVVEVLSADPMTTTDLDDLNYEIMEGGASGKVTVESSLEVTREQMAILLEAQGSDPSFLIGEEEGDETGA